MGIRRRSRLLMFATAVTAGGAAVASAAVRMGLRHSFGPGPGFFPFVIVLAMMLFAWMMAVRSEPIDATFDKGELARVLAVNLAIGVAFALLVTVGLLLGVAVLVFCLLVFAEKESYPRAALLAAAISGGLWVLFVHILGLAVV